jgi:hypothetical protein
MKIDLVVIGMILLVIVLLIVAGSKKIKKHQKYDNPPTKIKTKFIRNGDKEQDNKLVITDNESGNTISVSVNGDNIYYDKNSDGTNNIPMKNEGGKLTPVFDISFYKTKYVFDTDTDIGLYVGYIDGSKIGNESNNLDYGFRFSPIRIGDYVAPDLLLSPKATGIGLSVYPLVNSDYKILSHVGLGYGKVFAFQDNFSERNLFFISASFKF